MPYGWALRGQAFQEEDVRDESSGTYRENIIARVYAFDGELLFSELPFCNPFVKKDK